LVDWNVVPGSTNMLYLVKSRTPYGVSVCEWCSIGCRNEDEGHDDCELQTRQLREVQRLISSSWRLCCTCQGKCANNIRLISIFTLKPGQDYWENRLGNSGITT